MTQPNIMEVFPPGGACTRVLGLSVMKFPAFWFDPDANLFDETPFFEAWLDINGIFDVYFCHILTDNGRGTGSGLWLWHRLGGWCYNFRRELKQKGSLSTNRKMISQFGSEMICILTEGVC